ncbi:MAG TPA: DUF485 domain-containing protein [Propionibacterium sp.]|jgi:uncharacterized membrane protein (DUF485 family)|nr:DUF485 domain-containing protein [Propionibacterium sp.]
MASSASRPGDHSPPAKREPTRDEFVEVSNTPEFQQLRKNFRNFAFPLTVAFLVWYFAFVVLSSYATDFMSKPFIGHVTVGIFLGLLQFVTTFALTAMYIRHANKNLDPLATQLRERLEGGE